MISIKKTHLSVDSILSLMISLWYSWQTMIQIQRPNAILLAEEQFLQRYGKSRKRPNRDNHRARSSQRRTSTDRRQKMAPVYRSAIADIEQLAEPLTMYGDVSEIGTGRLAEWLPTDACGAYLGLCTLGPEIDTHIRTLSDEGDLLTASVLNEVALASILQLTQQIHDAVKDSVRPKGLRAGAAYRPGIGRWPLEVQRILFDLLPAQKIGVTLTEELLMLPAYSTSLIIPVRENRKSS